uniref:Uncharacterized protein n=1 Tax=Arundo donax TaxID=35708 RepID=A0A0A8YMY1_ARUDO
MAASSELLGARAGPSP